MKYLKKTYHFLGGAQFAIFLIASVALFVIAGTFIESVTDSHLYASLFTYNHPIFIALLWGFFVNILFSATRRWPFQVKHLPFLTTHLGLLMLFGGALAKHYWGVQGNMYILEGSGTHEIFDPENYAVYVEKRGETAPTYYALKGSVNKGFQSKLADGHGLRLHLVDYTPHSTEILESWIKGDFLTILGLNPMKVTNLKDDAKMDSHPDSDEAISPCGRACFHPDSMLPWHLYAIKSDDVANTLSTIFQQAVTLKISKRKSSKIITEIPLKQALESPFEIQDHGKYSVDLDLNFSIVEGFYTPSLTIKTIPGNDHFNKNYMMTIPLNGPQALLNIDHNSSIFGAPSFAIDLILNPTLAFIQDQYLDTHIFSFDESGHLSWQSFPNTTPSSMIAYDNGFQGYTVSMNLPIADKTRSREFREEALIHHMHGQLRQATLDGVELSPPLQLLQKASKTSNTDFADSCISFLKHWNDSQGWLYTPHSKNNLPLPPALSSVMEAIDWNNVPPHEYQGCLWASHLFTHFEPSLLQGKDLITVLKEKKWPLKLDFNENDSSENFSSKDLFTTILRQLFSAAELHPAATKLKQFPPEEQARLLSAYFRAYGIHLQTISPSPNNEEMKNIIEAYELFKGESLPKKIILEAMLAPLQQRKIAKKKIEDNTPKITLHARKGAVNQTIALTYNPNGAGLKWPILNGEYLIRFQSAIKEIPYHVRLRHARQINYANSNQPFSFESDLIISDRRNNKTIDTTISMNNVYETWDGYRFYLSAIAPPTETAIKRVQIVVNYDPTKYWLTYPGACILTCGILWLFFMNPYRRYKPKE